MCVCVAVMRFSLSIAECVLSVSTSLFKAHIDLCNPYFEVQKYSSECGQSRFLEYHGSSNLKLRV